MRKISIIAMVCLLSASILTGCRNTEPGTTGATQNNPSTSVRPQPSASTPGNTGSTPSATPSSSNASIPQGRMNPHT